MEEEGGDPNVRRKGGEGTPNERRKRETLNGRRGGDPNGRRKGGGL